MAYMTSHHHDLLPVWRKAVYPCGLGLVNCLIYSPETYKTPLIESKAYLARNNAKHQISFSAMNRYAASSFVKVIQCP
jgi:hypothetical protein